MYSGVHFNEGIFLARTIHKLFTVYEGPRPSTTSRKCLYYEWLINAASTRLQFTPRKIPPPTTMPPPIPHHPRFLVGKSAKATPGGCHPAENGARRTGEKRKNGIGNEKSTQRVKSNYPRSHLSAVAPVISSPSHHFAGGSSLAFSRRVFLRRHFPGYVSSLYFPEELCKRYSQKYQR